VQESLGWSRLFEIWSRSGSFAPLVPALQALRGVQSVAAVTLVAEIQDFWRLPSPRQLMACLGLVPGERPSDAKRGLGAITKAGNSPARRILGAECDRSQL
jgi:transposase